MNSAHHVHTEDAQPFRGLNLQKWRESSDACAINQGSDGSKLPTDLLASSGHSRLVRDVTREASGFGRTLLAYHYDLIQHLRVNVNQSKRMRFRSYRLRCGAADSAGATSQAYRQFG